MFSGGFLDAKEKDSTKECLYVVKEDDALSLILYNAGITGSKGFRLYGKGYWLEINQDANPQISNWHQLSVGEKLRIIVPSQIPYCIPTPEEKPPEKTSTEIVIVEPAPTPTPFAPPPSDADPVPEKEVKPAPLPPPKEPDPTEIEDKRTPAKKLKKKSRNSHWLRDRLSSAVSLRYGSALPTDNFILLPNIRQWSTVYESRYQPLRKIRVYFDYIPRVSETFVGNDYYLESTKLQVGRAVLFNTWENDTFEIVPKLGYWSYHAMFPDFTDVQADAVELKFEKQLNLGLDLSWEHEFGILKPRLLAGGDATMGYLGVGKKDSAGGTSYRTGFELAVKGPSIRWSTTSLTTLGYLFGTFESVKITRGTKTTLSVVKDTATENAAVETKDTSYNVNILGCGIGLAW